MKFLALLLLPLALIANPKASTLTSKHASYCDEALCLSGDVKLTCLLGFVEAQEAKIKTPHSSPLSKIQLENQIKASFYQADAPPCQIECGKATIDFKHLSGLVTHSEKKGVRFSGLSLYPFILECLSAHLSLEKTSVGYQIETIKAKGGVCASFADNSFIESEKGTYQKGQFTTSSLTTFSLGPDHIECAAVRLLTEEKKLIAKIPCGTLHTIDSSAPCHFSARTLTLDQKKRQLSLANDIKIVSQTIGTIECDGSVDFFGVEMGKSQDGKTAWNLEKIEAQGNIAFCQTRQGEDQGQRKVICKGLQIDYPNQTMTLMGDQTQKVLYEDDAKSLKIVAETILITQTKEGTESVQGIGNVRFFLTPSEKNALATIARSRI